MVDEGRPTRAGRSGAWTHPSTAPWSPLTLCGMTEPTWTPVVDSAEGAFSLELPTGWQADVRTLRIGQLTRRAVRAVSPDGSVRLSLHDPDLPDFFPPASGMFVQPPLQQLADYVDAADFLPQYLGQRFGRAPGFRLGPLRREPEIEQWTVQRGLERGVRFRAGVVAQRFGFTDGGRAVEALALGSTFDFGLGWSADVCVLFVTGGAEPDRALLLHAVQSERTNPQWRAAENQLFANQQLINQQQSDMWSSVMTQGHNQRMGDIAAAGAANTAIHEQRVAMGEAGTAAYLDRLNQPFQGVPTGTQPGEGPGLDQQHATINAIREEETVRTTSGEDVQVEAGADRYFVDERNRTWVGAQGNVQANDFTAAGLNPDDYQEGQLRR